MNKLLIVIFFLAQGGVVQAGEEWIKNYLKASDLYMLNMAKQEEKTFEQNVSAMLTNEIQEQQKHKISQVEELEKETKSLLELYRQNPDPIKFAAYLDRLLFLAFESGQRDLFKILINDINKSPYRGRSEMNEILIVAKYFLEDYGSIVELSIEPNSSYLFKTVVLQAQLQMGQYRQAIQTVDLLELNREHPFFEKALFVKAYSFYKISEFTQVLQLIKQAQQHAVKEWVPIVANSLLFLDQRSALLSTFKQIADPVFLYQLAARLFHEVGDANKVLTQDDVAGAYMESDNLHYPEGFSFTLYQYEKGKMIQADFYRHLSRQIQVCKSKCPEYLDQNLRQIFYSVAKSVFHQGAWEEQVKKDFQVIRFFSKEPKELAYFRHLLEGGDHSLRQPFLLEKSEDLLHLEELDLLRQLQNMALSYGDLKKKLIWQRGFSRSLPLEQQAQRLSARAGYFEATADFCVDFILLHEKIQLEDRVNRCIRSLDPQAMIDVYSRLSFELEDKTDVLDLVLGHILTMDWNTIELRSLVSVVLHWDLFSPSLIQKLSDWIPTLDAQQLLLPLETTFKRSVWGIYHLARYYLERHHSDQAGRVLLSLNELDSAAFSSSQDLLQVLRKVLAKGSELSEDLFILSLKFDRDYFLQPYVSSSLPRIKALQNLPSEWPQVEQLIYGSVGEMVDQLGTVDRTSQWLVLYLRRQELARLVRNPDYASLRRTVVGWLTDQQELSALETYLHHTLTDLFEMQTDPVAENPLSIEMGRRQLIALRGIANL